MKKLKNKLINKLKTIMVNRDWSTLTWIENPNKDLQLAAVKQDGLALALIKNPSYEVQLAAVKQNGLALQVAGGAEVLAHKLCSLWEP